MPTVLVFGASGAVGRYLLPMLGAVSRSDAAQPDRHYKILPVSRNPRAGWLDADLNDSGKSWPVADIVISLGPLDAFAAWLERQPVAPTRVIALGSMSAESKRESPNAAERALAERLRDSESRILAIGARRGLTCTLFRPTLIYGAGVDRSLAPIARFAQRWHVLPIPMGATGLRQPVHAGDLARACIAVIDCPASSGRIYELGGGERLTFVAMLQRLRAGVSGTVVPLPIPLPLLRITFSSVGAAAIERLRGHLLADNTDAERDFGYSPRTFVGADVLPRADANDG